MLIAQVAQHAEDLDRAVTCYTQILGAEPAAVFDPPGLAFFACGPTRMLLDAAAPSALLYFHVASVRDEIERLGTIGFEITTEPHVIFSHADDSLGPRGSDEWMAFVLDSEGNQVGFISHEAPKRVAMFICPSRRRRRMAHRRSGCP